MEKLKMGDIVEVKDQKTEFWNERIFIKYGKENDIIIVSDESEKNFINGEPFRVWYVWEQHWRIKQKPEYVPFTWEDRDKFMLKMIKSKTYKDTITTIIGCDIERVYTPWSNSYQTLFDDYEFLDGTPCGKIK